jgi:hypothetical protein
VNRHHTWTRAGTPRRRTLALLAAALALASCQTPGPATLPEDLPSEPVAGAPAPTLPGAPDTEPLSPTAPPAAAQTLAAAPADRARQAADARTEAAAAAARGHDAGEALPLPAAAGGAGAASPTSPAALLRARYTALREQLEHSPLKEPLYLESVESSGTLQGDVYAAVNYPLATVVRTFASQRQWCEALILHLNIKYCHAARRGQRPVLLVAIGPKTEQALGDAFRVEFSYSVEAATAEYLAVNLHASEGPFGSSNYRIALEAAALDAARSFLHLRFANGYGLLARLAMKAYLATSGSDKLGFTVIGTAADRSPRYIGGIRGAIERNTMRYYLAIDACLGAQAAPAAQRFERSLEQWFDATERYARQLHELDRSSYLAMKRREYLRQQTLQ